MGLSRLDYGSVFTDGGLPGIGLIQGGYNGFGGYWRFHCGVCEWASLDLSIAMVFGRGGLAAGRSPGGFKEEGGGL